MQSAPSIGRGLAGLALTLALHAVGATATRGDDLQGDPADAASKPDCLERAAVVVYLHALQDRVMDEWGLPPDSLYDQQVVVRFRLEASGSLGHFEVVSWTNGRLARSVEAAFAAAAPFVPLPKDALCLEGRSIQSRFENPSVPEDRPPAQ